MIKRQKKRIETSAESSLPQLGSIFQKGVNRAAIVSIFDNRGIVTYANNNLAKITGYPRAELLGSEHPVLNNRSHSRSFWGKMWRAVRNGKTWRSQVKCISKSGSIFWVDTFIQPISEVGHTNKFLSIMTDVTEFKRVESRLRESQSNLDRVQKIASIGSWEMSGKFSEMHWSDEFYRLHGLKPKSVQPSTRLRLQMIHPKDRNKLVAAIDEAVREGKPYAIEKRIILPDGNIRWILSQGEASKDAITGKPKVFGTLLDITAQKVQEEGLRQAHKASIEFRDAIDQSAIVYTTDPDGMILFANQNLCKVSGYSREELLGKSQKVFNSNFHGQKFWSELWKKVSSGTTWHGELRNKRRDGSFYWTDTFVIPFFDEKGKAREFLFTSSDITARMESERKLLELNETLRETLRFAQIGTTELVTATQQLTVSAELANMLGLRAVEFEEPFSKFIEKYVVEDDHATIMAVMAEGAQLDAIPRKQINLSFRMQTATGEIKHMDATGIFKNDGTAFGILQDVTARKKSELEREELLGRFEKIAAHVPGCFYQYRVLPDGSSHFPYASKGIEAIFGIKPEDVRHDASRVLARLNQVDANRVLESIDQSKATVAPWGDEFRVNHPSGKTIWVRGNASPQVQEDGSVLWHGYLSDVTEQHEKEEIIRQSERRFETLYNNTPAMLHSLSGNGTLLRVSDFWLKKMEYRRDEVLGQKLTKFLTEQSRIKMSSDSWPQFLNTGLLANVELEFITKSGKVLNTLLSAHGEMGPDGKIEKTMTVITDITDKKNLEREMEKLARVARHTSNSVVMTDEQARITWANDAFERITGYNLPETQGEYVSELLSGPETSEMALARLREVIANGENFRDEVLCYRKTGERVWLDIELIPVRNEARQVTGLIWIQSDVTSLKHAINELLNSEHRLQTMMSNSPNAVFMKDLRGRYIFYNDSFEKAVLGPDQADRHLLSDARAKLTDVEYAISLTQKPVSFEHEMNGRQFFTTQFPIQNHEGELYAIGGMSLDITERKFADKALRESEANLKSIFENADTGFVLIDRDLTIVSFNQIARQLIEKLSKRVIVVGDRIVSLANEVRDDQILDYIHRALAGEQCDYEQPFLVGESELWIHGRFFPVYSGSNVNRLIYAMSDITRRKANEFEIKQSRERMKLIGDNLPSVAIYQYEVSQNAFEAFYTYYSSGVEHITGLKADDLLRDPRLFEQRIHPDDYAQKQQLLRITDNSAFNQEYRFKHVSGEWRWLRTKSKRSSMPDGRVIWNGMIIDITEQKEMEIEQQSNAQALAESENRFRTMADAAPVLIWMSGVDKLCDYFNKGWLDFTGRTMAQELGNGWADGVHPADFDRCLAIYNANFDLRKPFVMEYRLRRHDGEYRWIVDHGTPRYLPNGEFTGFIGSCFDIHEMIETRRELQESEERLRSIIETEPNCVKVLNDRGELLEMNAAGLAMIEADSLADVKGAQVATIVDEAFRGRFIELTQSVLKGHRGTLQFSITGLKGTRRWLETRAVPLHDQLTRQSLLLGITRDITEEKANQSKLLDSLHEKELLIKEIHHRVKNNLQLISSIIYIRMNKMKHDDVRMFLEETRQKIKSIALIHERLLQSESVNEVEIRDYLGKLLLDMQMAHSVQDVKIEVRTEIDPMKIPLDAAIYCGLILNELVVNSTKYAFAGMKNGMITVNFKRKGLGVEFMIGDNGVGIPEDVHVGKGGFGMQMVEVFARQLKARCEIHRTGGTTFVFTF